MTYWQFHVAFLLPVLLVLLAWQFRRSRSAPRRAWLGIALIAAIALIYTTPWDNYLIWRGVWTYRPDRVALAWRVGYVPLEEYFFFVMQPILTGLCLLLFYPMGTGPQPQIILPVRSRLPQFAGATVATALGALGVIALVAGGRWLYAGLILTWGTPPLVLHWLYGGNALWRLRRAAAPAFLLATVYLWIADRAAIGAGIWSISTLHSTGWTLLGLPVEEALFFAVTNLLILQSLLLFWQRTGRTRAAVRPRP